MEILSSKLTPRYIPIVLSRLVVARLHPEGEKWADCTNLLWVNVLRVVCLGLLIDHKSQVHAVPSEELVATIWGICGLKSIVLILASRKSHWDEHFPILLSQTDRPRNPRQNINSLPHSLAVRGHIYCFHRWLPYQIFPSQHPSIE